MAIEISRNYDSTLTVTLSSTGDDINTTVTSSGSVVDSWLSTILLIHRRRLDNLVVGLDSEWRPSPVRNRQNPTAVIQLCVGRRCLIFQILHADFVPQSLVDFFNDARFTFVGVGIEQDFVRLGDSYGLARAYNTVDLRALAAEVTGRVEMRGFGLQSLARDVMGVCLNKDPGVTLSQWDVKRLSMQQVGYAAVDAFVSFEVGRMLMVQHN